MPTYEYACTTCGHHLEVVQSFTDEPLTACPECAAPLRKVFGAVGIVLKGSGFYKTDSRSAAHSSSGGNGSSSEGGGSEGGGSESSAAKESVPASKPAESSATPAGSAASAPAAN